MNKKISTPIAIIIIILCTILVGGVVIWQYYRIPKEKGEVLEVKSLEEAVPEEAEALEKEKENTEERTINLADATFEGEFVNQRNLLFKKAKECTEEQFISLAAKMFYPEKLTQGEEEELVQKAKEAKRCTPGLLKEIEKIDEEIYKVKYILDIPKECGEYPAVFYTMVPFIVEVNLTNNSAKTIKGEVPESEREIVSKEVESLKSKFPCVLLAHLIMDTPLKVLEKATQR